MNTTKWTKSKIIISVTIILVYTLMFFLKHYIYADIKNPFEKKIHFENLYSVKTKESEDKKSINIYRIDNSKKRISLTASDKKTSEETLIFEVDLDKVPNGENSWFSRIETGDDNKIYAVKTTKVDHVGSPLFKEGDIKKSFIEKLENTDAIDIENIDYWETEDEETEEQDIHLAYIKNKMQDKGILFDNQDSKEFINAMNDIIRDVEFFNKTELELFKTDELEIEKLDLVFKAIFPKEFADLITKNDLEQDEIIKRNRILLELCFPNDILKHSYEYKEEIIEYSNTHNFLYKEKVLYVFYKDKQQEKIVDIYHKNGEIQFTRKNDLFMYSIYDIVAAIYMLVEYNWQTGTDSKIILTDEALDKDAKEFYIDMIEYVLGKSDERNYDKIEDFDIYLDEVYESVDTKDNKDKFYNILTKIIDQSKTQYMKFERICINKISGKDLETLSEFDVMPFVKMNKIAYNHLSMEIENVFLSTYDGQLLKFDVNKEEEVWSGQEEVNPVFMQVCNNGGFQRLCFFNEMKRGIYSLDINEEDDIEGSSKIIYSENDLRADIKNFSAMMQEEYFIAESLNYNEIDNSIVAAVSDYVVLINLDNINEKMVFQKQASYKHKYIYVVMLYWLLSLLVLILLCLWAIRLGIILKRYICRKVKRKMIACFMLVFFCTALMFVSVLYTMVKSNYESEIKNQLSSKVNIATSEISIDDLKKITSPGNFDGMEYRRIKSTLLSVQQDTSQTTGINTDEPSNVLSRIKKSIGKLLFPALPQKNYFSVIYKLDKFYDRKGMKENSNIDDLKNYHLLNFCVASDDRRNPFHPYFIIDKYENDYEKAITYGNIQFIEDYKDASGEYMICIRDIVDNESEFEDKVIGICEIGINKDIFDIYMKSLLKRLLIASIVVLLIGFLIINIFARNLTFNLDALKDGVKMLNGTRWETLNIRSGDDLEEISDSVNNMIAILKKTQTGYSRFVPPEVNKHINDKQENKPIYDINLRDYQTMKVGVMITGIRSFYSITGDMDAKDRFDFINDYLQKVGSPINEHNGFIIEFMGNGVMALFPEHSSSDELLKSALDMQGSIKKFCFKTSKSKIKYIEMGIGLHICEEMIFGIVGYKNENNKIPNEEFAEELSNNEEIKQYILEAAASIDSDNVDEGESDYRLDVAAIDKGVVLVELLKEASRELGAAILATDSVIDKLEDKSRYKYRYLGRFTFSKINNEENVGNEPDMKNDEYDLFDVYQNDENTLFKNKEKTKKDFDKAVLEYQQGNFAKAKEMFVNIISSNNEDKVSKLYYFLCDEYIKKKPDDWSRVIKI